MLLTDENKYNPLTKVLAKSLMQDNSNALINRIINYRYEGVGPQTFQADQIDSFEMNP